MANVDNNATVYGAFSATIGGTAFSVLNSTFARNFEESAEFDHLGNKTGSTLVDKGISGTLECKADAEIPADGATFVHTFDGTSRTYKTFNWNENLTAGPATLTCDFVEDLTV